MTFKPKRTPPAELARMIEQEAGATHPTTTPSDASIRQVPLAVVPVAVPRADPTTQINFRGSIPMAKLIAELAELEGGSTRKLFARLLKDAGHELPESDLNPFKSRRRYE